MTELNRRIYIDLDNTLIDTIRLMENSIAFVNAYGVTRKQYMAASDECMRRWNMFSFDNIFSVLKETHPDLPEEMLNDLKARIVAPIFFHDALDFLTRFDRSELVLVTQGAPEVQEEKLRIHDLARYFGEIMILSGAAKSTAIDPSAARWTFLVDDSPSVIDEVKRAHPSVICIRVRKPPPWELPSEVEQISADVEVETLYAAKVWIFFNSLTKTDRENLQKAFDHDYEKRA